ncbi:MAG: BglII/BstYI family type II restriction endonuclease [Gemmatimonadales bacterium]
MHIESTYSHLNGLEFLQVHRPNIWTEIQDAIARVDAAAYMTKVSKEKTKKGKLVYSPDDLNQAVKTELAAAGWESRHARFWTTDDEALIRETLTMKPDEQRLYLEKAGKTPIVSYNQTDFVKQEVHVEVQLGKYSFIPYDLFVKHMAFFTAGIIRVGIEIVPSKTLQKDMSSGPGYFEKALYDVVRLGRGVPAMPLVMLGVAP